MNSQSPEIYTDESPEISFSSISDGTTDSIRRSNDNTQIKNHSNSSDSHTSIGNSGSRSDDQFYAANSNGLGNSTISSGNTAEGSVQDIPGTGFSAGNAEVGNASGLDSEERTDFENDIASAINGFVARVEAHKNYPYMAQRRNVEGTSVIHVVLNESGYISHLSVVSSAGDILDKAAMDAVREACPYMHGLKRDLSMDIPIHFYQE
ncbi:energy transducer TonB [Pectinatus haikarae]|uniref:Protein TonB n=2 Tax=Pectinatus haikarae TaxID=349096 RepID=A0ABT9Y589_9FIRM|nr:energy transducer TonB [Pectinatus haikarae]MDQ0202987.1 protein TonB [Pectinatus haikarae]